MKASDRRRLHSRNLAAIEKGFGRVRRSTSRALLIGLAVSALLTALVSPALAAPTCSYDSTTRTMTVTVDGGATIRRDPLNPDYFQVFNGTSTPTWVSCTPTQPSVFNTDTIAINASGNSAKDVVLDMSVGTFAPGFTDEPGSSDEIEIVATLGPSIIDSLTVVGGTAPDKFVMGSTGINFNPKETDGRDVDITTTSAEYLKLVGGDGPDVLSAAGGSATGGPRGGGSLLQGHSGADLMLAGPGNPLFFPAIFGGPGVDTVSFARTDSGRTVDLALAVPQETGDDGQHLIVEVENLIGSPRADSLSGTDTANRIAGGAGADELAGRGGRDVLIGGRGTDTCGGGPGADTIKSCEE